MFYCWHKYKLRSWSQSFNKAVWRHVSGLENGIVPRVITFLLNRKGMWSTNALAHSKQNLFLVSGIRSPFPLVKYNVSRLKKWSMDNIQFKLLMEKSYLWAGSSALSRGV